MHLIIHQDAYAEPGQDTRNIAGLEVVVIVQDVQDVPPVFTSAPPVTRLPAGLLPGDKVYEATPIFNLLVFLLLNILSGFRFYLILLLHRYVKCI